MIQEGFKGAGTYSMETQILFPIFFKKKVFLKLHIDLCWIASSHPSFLFLV